MKPQCSSPESTVPLFKLLPAEVQAACAESISGLCTSGQACQSVRQGVEGGRVACYGKRAACMPRGRLRAAVSIPDPHPVSATSGPTEDCHTGQRRASGAEGYHHAVTASGVERQLGSKGQCSCLFIEIFLFVSPVLQPCTACYLSCHSKPSPWRVAREFSSLLVIQHQNKYDAAIKKKPKRNRCSVMKYTAQTLDRSALSSSAKLPKLIGN